MPLELEKSDNDQENSTTIEKAQEIESEIYNSIYSKHLTVVGWYRSKPAGTRALPSLRDSEAQLDHQIKLLGSSDATYSPCIGMIISPYTSGSTESELLTYWTVSSLKCYFYFTEEYLNPFINIENCISGSAS